MLSRVILRRPIVSEKSLGLAKGGLYTFEVDSRSTKLEIAKLFGEKFNVKVESVKTVNIKPKIKLQRSKRGYFKTPSFKKALIQVGKGEKIALFETIAKENSAEVTTEESETIKEKKSLLKKTKVKVEKITKAKKQDKKSIAKKKGKK